MDNYDKQFTIEKSYLNRITQVLINQIENESAKRDIKKDQ
jgi:hypothetical protein